MQLLLLLAVVSAVAISEQAPQQPVSDAWLRAVLACLAMAVAPLFAVATSSMIAGSLRRDFQRKPELLRRFGRLRNVHLAVWFLAAAAVLYLLGWAQLVRFNWSLDGVFLLDDIATFLPVVVPLVLSWGAFYEVERCLHRHSGKAADDESAVTRGQYVNLHARHYLGLLLLPAFAVLAVQDVIRYMGPALPGESEALLLCLPVGGMLLFFPLALRYIWKTESLPKGALRDRLMHLCQRAGFRPGDLIVWRTDRMIVNAAVAGLAPPWRYVFFTDLLLARFDEDEVELILAHEIGHVRHHHLLDRLLVMALPIALWFVVATAFPQLVSAGSDWLAALGLPVSLQPAAAGPVALALYSITVFAAFSRRLEHDADLFAARACHLGNQHSRQGCHEMADLLEKLAVVAGMDRDSRSWLHPSIGRRVALLERVAAAPALGDRFEEQVRWLRRGIFTAIVAALAYLAIASA